MGCNPTTWRSSVIRLPNPGEQLEEPGGQPAMLPSAVRHLAAAPQVPLEHRIHQLRERTVVERETLLRVFRHRAYVEVDRPDRREQAVDDQGLGVKHRGLVLDDR